MIMEENTRSGDSSGVVVKNRNSSGCLIIKKKAGGGGSLGSRPVFDSKKEKKRSRLMVSDSGSSDDVFKPYRRRIGQACNGYEKGIVEERDSGRKNNSLDHIKKRSDVDEGERKRSKLDIFEFDEYDFSDGRKLKKEYMVDRDVEIGGRSFLGSKPVGGSGIRMEYETGSSKGDIVYRRKHSYFDSSSSLIGKNRGNEYPVKTKFETKRDIAQKPVSLSREKFGNTSEEPIRVQGRNGVLKLMPNKKNKGSGLLKTYDRLEADDYRKGLRSVDTVKRNESARHLFFSEPKVQEKAGSSVRTAKNKLKLGKSLATKSSLSTDSESDDSDMSLKLGPKKVEGNQSAKLVSGKGEITPPSENIQLTGSNDGKIKRGSGTEKQKLRQQIRKMLLDAGWTIDYRPRRNRDYQDAVYVNPSGTAYWSIIKAYDALQKQFDEEDDNIKPAGESSSFTPISGDVLNKLTRQTRKKIEKEMKRKHRDEAGTRNAREAASKKSANHKHDSKNMGSARAEEKLSSFLKQGGKSSKGKINENALVSPSIEVQNSTDLSHEANHMSMDNSSGNLSLHGRKSRKLGRCTLVVRSANKALNSETDGYVPNAGKLTLLSWLIDSEIVGSSEKVQYMNRRRTRVMQEGWITREGIHCGCCSKILTVSKFEIHAGSKLRQPFQNIYLETGSSLLQCQIDAWNRQEESERSSFHSVYIDGDDPNDDTCGICGDGGDLICCDGCPSTFHQNCLGIQMLPTGDWHCPNCTCKFCGMAGGGSARGNNVFDFSLGTCSLCEKKYHLSCMQDVDALPVDSTVPSTFCGQNCRELFENLQKFLGIKHELEAGFSWSLIHRTDIDPDTSLRGFPQKVESNSKLAVALTVMDECFLPIVDRRSGINLIHNVLYNCGSNFSRLNYCGFYTAVLERGDEIISAASIRFHGTQLAEMPFIGTRHIYRRQGMCRRLFLAIESALRSFKVEKLIIPAISELMHTWTEVFGFNYLEESQRQELRFMNMLVFPGIDMLQKMLTEEENNHQDKTTNTGAKPMKVEGQHSSKSETLDEVDQDPLAGKDPFESHDDSVPHMKASDDEVTASDSASQSLEVALNDSPSSLGVPEVEVPVSSEKIMSPSSQSGDKVSESATELKSIFLADSSNEDRKMQDNPILVSPGGEIKSSAEGGVDAVNVCKNAASVESVFHSLETVSQHNDTGKGDENMKATPVSSSRSADRSSMPLDSGLDCHSPDVKEGHSCEASKAPCNAIHSDNTSVQVSPECSGTNVCEMRTDSQSGQNLAESASDSRTDVFDVITRSHSGDYLAESTPVAKCLSPSDVNQAASKLETEPAVDALGACRSPSSLDAGIDGLSVNGGVACLEPVLHTLGEDSGHDRSKEEIGEDTSANFVSNSDSIKESIVQFNLDSSSKNASCEVGINLSGPSEVAAGGMHSKESIDYLSGEC